MKVGSVPYPNMEAEARDATRQIYRLGALHVAYLLRGTDFEDVPSDHVDTIAGFIEREVRHQFGPTEWKLPVWWTE